MTNPDTPSTDELLGAIQTPAPTAPTQLTASVSVPPQPSVDETAEKVIRKLRDEAAANRVKANEVQAAKEAADAEWAVKVDQAAQEATKRATDDLAQKFGKMFGLVDDTVEHTPEQLIAQAEAKRAETEAKAAAEVAEAQAEAAAKIAAAESTVRAQGVALAVHQHAGDDVDAKGLLDSVDFNQRIAKLDPSSEDFQSQMDTEMSSFLEANPGRFRKATGLVTTVPRSGGMFEAGNAAPPPGGEPSVEQLLKQVQESRSPGNRASRTFRNE